MRNVFVYSEHLARQEYKPSHPFKPMRARLMYELLKRHDLVSGKDRGVVNPVLMDEELLYLFHTREYIDLLKKGGKKEVTTETFRAGLGTQDNPIFSGMYDYALSASSATFQGAMMLHLGEARFVFNPSGGFHHAGRSHAEGFCYINDIAFTIAELVRRGERVAYIDIDAHHGNGVQDAFYGTDKVLNISLHESGKTLYPGTGFENETGQGEGTGYTVNIPFHEGTDDETYLLAFETLVPPLVKSFRPDIVVACIGCDTHRMDPLTHFNLTSNGYMKVISIINELSPRILALGGGGYNQHRTAALWALAWATFSGLQTGDLGRNNPEGILYGPEAGAEAGQLADPPFSITGQEKEACLADARRVIDYVKTNIFPLQGIQG